MYRVTICFLASISFEKTALEYSIINLQPRVATNLVDSLSLTCLHLAADGIWTHDLVLTKDALYPLSYSSKSDPLVPVDPADRTINSTPTLLNV